MQRILLCVAAGLLAVPASFGEALALKDAAAARKVYVAKCAKCHKFYDPKAYSEEEWARWMQKMSVKSKLTREQADLLQRYLAEYRAGRIAKAR